MKARLIKESVSVQKRKAISELGKIARYNNRPLIVVMKPTSPTLSIHGTDPLSRYINEDKMFHDYLPNDTVWFDCGTHERLLEASNFVHAIQNRTTQIVGDIRI